MSARAFVLGCCAVLLVASSVRAQEEATPSSTSPSTLTAPALAYSLIDRATVRVIAVEGVGAQRVASGSRRDRMLAVPVASHGSGVLVSADGLVVTARHVVRDARLLAVWLPGDPQAYEASVVYVDDTLDFAIIAVDGTFSSFVPLEPLTRALRVREPVGAIGYPIDVSRTDPQSCQGIVAGVLPDGSLQLDIALNPGNSGGPLIDADEHVIGIVVARGDLDEGVQGIGVAVPAAPIIAAMTTEVPTRVAEARARLAAGAHDDEVAGLVRLLVRVGGAELIHDVIQEMEGHGQSEVLERLRALEAVTTDPDVASLLAAYYWDAAAVVLERAGGLMRVSEMPMGSERDLANELMTRALRLAHSAARTDPTLLHRSPFVRRLVYYFSAPAGTPTAPVAASAAPEADAPSIAPQPQDVSTAATQATDSEAPPTPPPPPRPHDPNHDHRLRLGGSLALTSATDQSFSVVGAIVVGTFAWSPITARVGIVAFDPLVGLSVGIGAWGDPLFHLTAEVGGMFRFGDRYAGVVGAAWTPSLGVAHGNGYATLGGWHAYAGAQIEDFLVTLGWRGIGVPGDYSLHEYELGLLYAFD